MNYGNEQNTLGCFEGVEMGNGGISIEYLLYLFSQHHTPLIETEGLKYG